MSMETKLTLEVVDRETGKKTLASTFEEGDVSLAKVVELEEDLLTLMQARLQKTKEKYGIE